MIHNTLGNSVYLRTILVRDESRRQGPGRDGMTPPWLVTHTRDSFVAWRPCSVREPHTLTQAQFLALVQGDTIDSKASYSINSCLRTTTIAVKSAGFFIMDQRVKGSGFLLRALEGNTRGPKT